ncbi:MAG: HU family DNA-binding protein [Bacteroidaceae bacterium]|nr:HU family DNA-binding protein [Bacteroidaceae bacterium]
MAIRIKTIPRKKPGTSTFKYYIAPDTQTALDKAEFLDRMEKRSTMSSADVKGCLDALEYELKQALLGGNSVRLGDLGSFHISLTSQGVEKKDDASADLIKRVKVQFRPSSALMRDMQAAPTGKARFIQSAKQSENG